MWMPRGEEVRVPAPGVDRRVPIYGALNYRTNHVSFRLGQGKNATEFLGFLAQLAAEYRDRPCLLVLNNASYHTAAVVRQYLEELGSHFEVLWLLPYCPELNDLDRVWKYVKGASLANYDFGQVASLRQAISEAFDQLNNAAEDDLTLRFRDPLSKNLVQAA
jgi:transposase